MWCCWRCSIPMLFSIINEGRKLVLMSASTRVQVQSWAGQDGDVQIVFEKELAQKKSDRNRTVITTQTYANVGTWTREHPLLCALWREMFNIKGLARNTDETWLSLGEKNTEDKVDETSFKMQGKLLLISTKTVEFSLTIIIYGSREPSGHFTH